MAEMKGKKKRLLPINLSFLTLTDPKKQTKAQKSPRNFEEPNGVVGLGILAAMNDDRRYNQDPTFNNGGSKILAISPKSASNPIPILGNKNVSEKINCKEEEMEFCEEYTCVISHVGKNQIKKTEYFEADILGNNHGFPTVNGGCSDFLVSGGGEAATFVGKADFLSSCFLCGKMLHGLDVFMYRGEKAFCSAECRYRQICTDEQKEKCRSGARTPMKYSVSPCSVAAA